MHENEKVIMEEHVDQIEQEGSLLISASQPEQTETISQEAEQIDQKEALWYSKSWRWIKEHKNEVAAGTAGVVFIGAVVSILAGRKSSVPKIDVRIHEPKLIPNASELSATTSAISETIMEVIPPSHSPVDPQIPFNVGMHIRNMGMGKHHSLEKEAEAFSLGISLLPNQTIVDAYTKGVH